jgi:hypothetical protein
MLPVCASHSPSSTSFGLAAKVIKLPFTMRFEYSSRKKNGGLREPADAELSGAPWLSNDMAEDNAGECGIGGTFEGCCEVGDAAYGVVGDGDPPLPGCCWLPLLERPASPWRLRRRS